MHFKKMTWAAIPNDPQSREVAEQLGLSADNFDTGWQTCHWPCSCHGR